MSLKQRFLHSTSAKTNMAWVIIAILLVLVVFGGASLPKINLAQFNLGNLGNLGGGGGNNGQVNVDKQVKFALVDTFAGSALTSKTIYVYDDQNTLLESLTTGSDGTVNTAFTYPSGKHIYVKYVNSNSKQWFDIVIPQMNPSDAESATYNNIPLKSFTIGTYTGSVLTQGATTISDSGEYNGTTNGDTPTFSYKVVNTGSDNTGMMTSYDPVYREGWTTQLYVTFSGTGYETILPYGFSSDFTLGTTHYVAQPVDVNAMTKWKIGNNYVAGYDGVKSYTWSLDMTGYPAGSSGVTMQLYLYSYTDPAWVQAHGGNYGTSAYQLDEITVTIKS